MLYNLYPYTSSFLCKSLGRRDRSSIVSLIEEINPTETGLSPGIDITDEDRARITGTLRGGEMKTQMQRVDQIDVVHSATMRYEVRNVLAAPNGIFGFRDVFRRAGPKSNLKIPWSRVPRYEKGFFSLPGAGITHFAHWLLDGLATSYLRRPDEQLFLPVPPRWNHAREYVSLLEIERVPSQFAYFDRLAFAEDVGMTTSKVERLAKLKTDLRRRIGQGNAKRVYLRRGRTGMSRELANERELVEALQRQGFVEIDVTEPLHKLHAALQDIDVCVSIEGSHMMHALLAAPREALYVVINPADRFVTAVAGYLRGLGGRMATVVAERDGSKYRVHPESVLAALSRNGIANVSDT